MRQIFGFWYALFILGLFGLLTLARVNDGSVLVMNFGGDALHMAQIVLRMADGQIPHQDFMTPLGAMAFLPIVWLVNLGFGVGTAFAYASVLIGLFLLPALYWIGVSRLAPSGALGLAVVVLVGVLALVHGGVDATVTLSMYYNNWCWAVAGLVVVQVVLPSQKEGRVAGIVEPLILGCAMGFLVLTKATFAVFLLPAVLVSLLVAGRLRLLGAGIVVALVFLLAFTVKFGLYTYWAGYVQDLMFVAQSNVRAQPGDALSILVLRPVQFVGVLGLFAGFMFLRQAQKPLSALVFMLLGVGWILISHQNWQNDPHWLAIAGLIMIGMSGDVVRYNRFGWPLQTALRVVAVVFFVAAAPLWLAQAQSLLIHQSLDSSGFSARLADKRHDSLKFQNVKGAVYWIKTPHPVLGAQPQKADSFAGWDLPSCEKSDDTVVELEATGKALDALPYTNDAQVLYADWVNAVWLFSNTQPLKNGAPWYYGGTPGFENAQYLVVPKCPLGTAVRRIILQAVENDPALSFEFKEETPFFYLFESNRK